MFKKSSLVVASLLGVAVLTASMYTTKISAYEKTNPNPDFTNERIISISEKKDLQQSLSNIVTEFGTFKRSDVKIETPHVDDIDNVDSQTEQIVTDYGIFIKE